MSKAKVSILRDQRGVSAVIFAVLLIPLIGMLGLAVDTTRAYSVRHRLQESIDAAALAGGKNFSDGNRNQIITDYFNANWKSGFQDTDTPTLSFSIDPVDRTVTVNASVNMGTVFMPVFGINSVQVGTLASSVSGQTFLEVGLALDNTVSMNIQVGGVRRIDAMKTAATNFLNTLYTENAVLQNTIPNQSVSIIPFTSMVNIGTQNSSFLAANSTNHILWDYPKNTTTQNSWRGCVFERSFYNEGTYAGRDMTDDSPAVEPFWPYHIPAPQFEAITFCTSPPATTTTSTSTSVSTSTSTSTTTTTTTPPPVCNDGDGNVVPCPKYIFGAVKSPEQRVNSNIVQVASACSSANPQSRYGMAEVGDWSSYRIFTPALSYQTSRGIWVQYARRPSDGNVQGFNRLYPDFWDGSAAAGQNVSGASACCGSPVWYGDHITKNTWTLRLGRWIEPWSSGATSTPSATPSVSKIGGWGNSGCGLPMLPLTEDRTTLIAKINEMEVPANTTIGYGGTLINEGLVWGWRSVSEHWRGFWKNSDSTPIDATVPRDHTTPGVSKAVVVMTDGLNFLPDLGARTYYTGAYHFAKSTLAVTPLPDPNIRIGGGAVENIAWIPQVDNSAYGIMKDMWEDINKPGSPVDFCRRRQGAGFEPHLSVWGCREYDCMLRNAAGTSCVRSAAGFWGPYDLQSALTGPYYNELTRRLLVTCNNMRAQNIRMFFILFDIAANPQKAAAMAAFNTCVGADGGVYDAADPVALNTAFQDIAIKLRQLRLQQ